MNLVRRHLGRGGGLQGPAVIFVAARARPHACHIGRDFPLGLQFGNLALERSHDRSGRHPPGPRIPIACDMLLTGSPSERFDQGSTLPRALQRDVELLDGLVDEERGRDEADGASGLHPLQLPIELRRKLRQPRQIGLGVGTVLNGMIGIEELRSVDVGADVLNHDVGRVAPGIAGDGRVAIGECQTFELVPEGIFHDLDAGPRREAQLGCIDGFDTPEIVFDNLGKPPLARCRAIRQPRAQRGHRTLVDTKTRRRRRIVS